MKNTHFITRVAISLLLASPALLWGHGETLFGHNKRATRKAMKEMSRALGVRCKHCHIGTDFHQETPNKDIARLMKLSFVDSLALNGRFEIKLPETVEGQKDSVEKRLIATYEKAGEDPGIHLKAVSADGKMIFEQRLSLPASGQGIDCGTCHAGKLRFMTRTP